MKTNPFVRVLSLALLSLLPLSGQARQDDEVNDVTTPLHLLQPDYNVLYGAPSRSEVEQAIRRIYTYIDEQTPCRTNADGTLQRGAFRLCSYEWGITYQALLRCAQTTGDKTYSDYVEQRFRFIAQQYPIFKKRRYIDDGQMEQICNPRALDDCGTMCCAMMKAQGQPGGALGLDSVINNYYDFLSRQQYRLDGKLFARHRPQRNTVWLDDMYMGIPALAERGLYTSSQAPLDEAADMYVEFVNRMWVEEKGLYRHGYVEGLTDQPTYHWARANGWALLTTVELLDMLPADHPRRPFILQQLRRHIRGLAQYQSSEGVWHQLLDRSDSYLETSATAIYTYCIARAVNCGWLDAVTYGPVAVLGWNALSTKITDNGRVEGTCVGTGMAFDPAFYYYRPVSAAAAHGYGPALWAAAEMLALLDRYYPRTNDSGLHFYDQPQTNPSPLFYLTEDGRGEAVK